MKAFLMYAGRDFDMAADLPDSVTALTEDLGLNTLFDAMSGGDEFLLEVARRGVLTSLPDAGAIAYRQHVLADCLENAPVARDMYDVAVEAVLGSKRIYRGIFARSPDATLRWSIEALQLFTGLLRRLRQIADSRAAGFHSEGFRALFAALARELDEEYFQAVDDHLSQLRFRGGVLLSAELGQGAKGTRYVLRRGAPRQPGWLSRISGPAAPATRCGSATGTRAATRPSPSCGAGRSTSRPARWPSRPTTS